MKRFRSGGALALGCLLGPVQAAAGDDAPPYAVLRVTRLADHPAATAGGSARLDAAEHRLQLGLAGNKLGACRVDVGLDYQYTRYEYSGVASRNRDLHRLQLPLRCRTDGAAWDVDAYLAPGVSTSSNVFKSPGRWAAADAVVTAGISGTHALNAHWSLLAGIAHDRSFGAARTYPVAGLRYAPHARWHLRIAYPRSELQLRPHDRQQLTLRVYPAGHRWHVVTDDFDSDFDYGMRAVRSEGTWSMRLLHGLTLDLTLGFETGRRHRLHDAAGARVHVAADDQWSTSVGLRFGQAPLLPAHGQWH